jgi:hypothetical protein
MLNLISPKLAAIYYLTEVRHHSPRDALTQCDEVELFAGSLEDYAATVYEISDYEPFPAHLRPHLRIDYESVVHQHRVEGSWHQFDFEGITWTCANAYEH